MTMAGCNLTLPNSIECSDERVAMRVRLYQVALAVMVVCALDVVLNAVVLWATFCRIKQQFSSTLRLTVSLGLSDLWTAVLVATAIVYNSYLYWVHGIKTNACVATLLETARTGGFVTCSLHSLALAVNHLLNILRPYDHEKLLPPSRALSASVVMWLLPPVCLLIYSGSIPDQGFQSPYVPEFGYCTSVRFWNVFEFRFFLSLFFFVPFLLTSIIYAIILLMLNHRTRTFRHGEQLERQKRALRAAFWIWLSFLICWLPPCMLFVLTCDSCPLRRDNVDTVTMSVVSFLSNLLILLKSLVNPFIYATRIPQIRNALVAQLRPYWPAAERMLVERTVDRARSSVNQQDVVLL